VQTAEPTLGDTSVVSQSVTNNRCAPHVGGTREKWGAHQKIAPSLANCFRRHCVEVGLGPSHIVLDGDPAPSPQKGIEHSPNFRPILLSTNGWMHQDATWYVGKPQPRRLCVRWGPSFPSPKGAQSSQFSANVRCGQTTGWTLGMEVGFGPDDFMFDGDPATPRTEGTPTTTQFLAHVYCGQTAEWMKKPLGTEVDFGPGHIALDGVPALRGTGTAAPSSRPVSIVATVAHLSY